MRAARAPVTSESAFFVPVFRSRREMIGEPARIRTEDLLIKSQLLCQLSYGLPCARQL